MKTNKLILAISSIMILASCTSTRKESSTTGWEYNNSKNGGFETNKRFVEQATGPGLTFIEGGTFTMGRVEQDVMYEWDNVPRRALAQDITGNRVVYGNYVQNYDLLTAPDPITGKVSKYFADFARFV